MTAASETAFRIQRWHNDILVPFEDQAAADDVRRRVDVALEAELAQALSGVLDGVMAADGSIVFVRRLDFDWTIDAAWNATDIARQCALALTREVVAELASPSSGNVVRFNTRADYLAAYVVARATGAATSWLHAAFDGWSALPASAAIRSALCADPDAGLAALRTLGRSSLMAMAEVLADGDALQIVAQLAAATSSDAAVPMLDACLSVAPPRSLVERPACGVWLLAQTTLLASAATIAQTGAVMAALHRSSARRGLALDETLLRALGNDHAHLSALIAATAGTRANLDRVAAGILAQAAGASACVGSIAHTAFGGVFFLLDDVDQEEQMPSAATLAVLGYAVNGQNWRPVFDDPFWRDRFSVAPTVSAADVVAELNMAGKSLEIAANELLGRFLRRLRGFAASGGDYVRKNFLSTHAAVELEPDRVVVTLSRPPLDLVLSMAGVNRGVRRWPWLDPRPFLFFSEDA